MGNLTYKEMILALQQAQLKALNSGYTISLDVNREYTLISIMKNRDERKTDNDSDYELEMISSHSINEEYEMERYSRIMSIIRDRCYK